MFIVALCTLGRKMIKERNENLETAEQQHEWFLRKQEDMEKSVIKYGNYLTNAETSVLE